jgi:hypothetical protein
MSPPAATSPAGAGPAIAPARGRGRCCRLASRLRALSRPKRAVVASRLPSSGGHAKCATTMFVRFRQTARRLQASLIATSRYGGKIRHEHIAALGSAPSSPSVEDRITFWTKLHQRLDMLPNRVDTAQRGAILAAIHARIPMPTLDDQQTVRLAHARADVRLCAIGHASRRYQGA